MRKCVQACQLVLLSLVMALPGNAQQLTPEQPLEHLTQAVEKLNKATNPSEVTAALGLLDAAHRGLRDSRTLDAAGIERQLNVLSDRLSERADSYERDSQWKEAELCLELLNRMESDRRGNDAWQTRDARRRVADLKRQQALPATEQAKLQAAKSLDAEATTLYESGEFADALTKFEEVADTIGNVLGKEHPKYATSLSKVASLYRSNGDYARAESLLIEAKSIIEQTLGREHPHYGLVLSNLAVVYDEMADTARAEPLYLEAMAIRAIVNGKQHPHYADSLNNLASLYVSTADYSQAEPLYLEAKAIYESVLGKEHRDYAMSVNNLASLYLSKGDYARAEQLFVESITIQERTLGKDHPNYANSLNNLAWMYQSMGDYARAEPLHREAKAICERVLGKEHPSYATSLNNLAELCRSMGDAARAEAFYLEALGIVSRVIGKHHPFYAQSLNNLANLYLSKGDYARAEPLFIEAMTVRERVLGNEHPDYATSLSSLAGLYELMGNYTVAEPLFLKAMTIREMVLGKEHPDYATSLNNLSGLYQSMGDPARAESLQLEAMAIQDRVLCKEDPKHALEQNNLAWLYSSMGDYRQAEPLLVDALQQSTRFVLKTLRSQSEAAGLELLRSDNFAGADALLSVRRQLPDSDQAETYRLSWQSRGLLSALLSERQLARSDSPEAAELYKVLRGVSGQLAQLTLASVPEDQRESRRKRLGELNEQKESLERQLGSVSESFRRGEEIAQSTPDDLMQWLPEQVAIVDLIETTVWNRPESRPGDLDPSREYDAFVLRKQKGRPKVQWLHLGPAEEINLAISDWLALIDQDRGEATSQSHPSMILRQRLWEPLEAHLSGVKHVVVIPGSSTAFIPWSALPGKQPGTFLLEDYTISTALSGQELYRQLTDPESDKQALLLVGGVDYQSRQTAPTSTPTPAPASTQDDSEAPELLAKRSGMVVPETRVDWPYLDGTMNEAEAIQSLWHSNPAVSFLQGAEANEELVQSAMPEARYLHLATHGFFADGKFRSILHHDPNSENLFGSSGSEGLSSGRSTVSGRNPLILCGVVLAGANLPVEKDEYGLPTGADGILTAQEVLHTDLRGTELVTLSACDTGRGTQVAGGEGIYGLQRAFHLAGARHVVASLWKVDDQATAALMKLFYRNLWHENQQPAEALRNAQLTLLNHPEQIEALASTRGPNFDKTVQVTQANPAGETRADNAPSRAPIRLWAAFTHSGPPIAPVEALSR